MKINHQILKLLIRAKVDRDLKSNSKPLLLQKLEIPMLTIEIAAKKKTNLKRTKANIVNKINKIKVKMILKSKMMRVLILSKQESRNLKANCRKN